MISGHLASKEITKTKMRRSTGDQLRSAVRRHSPTRPWRLRLWDPTDFMQCILNKKHIHNYERFQTDIVFSHFHRLQKHT